MNQSSCPEHTNVQIIKRKMHKRTSLMSDISSKILPNNNIPPSSIFLINFSFYDTSNFTKLLCLKNISKIGNLFNSSVGNTNDSTFFLWVEIWHFDKNLFEILVIVLIIIFLKMVGIVVFIFIIYRAETVFVLLFANNVLVLQLWHCYRI